MSYLLSYQILDHLKAVQELDFLLCGLILHRMAVYYNYYRFL